MATGATGTPTTLGIPKLSPSADAPSGVGINNMMDAIDALVADRIEKPAAPTTGQGLVWDGSAWVADDILGVPGYGTSLPGSPVDGDEYVLVDSTTAPTYQWRFRYNASNAGTNKWEFVGGAEYSVWDTGSVATSAGSPTDLGGSTLTVPRNGTYNVIGRAGVTATATGSNSQIDVYASGVGTGVAAAGMINIAGGAQSLAAIGRLALTSGQVLKLRYSNSNGQSASFVQRYLGITPVAVI